jgi:hypothetical protein
MTNNFDFDSTNAAMLLNGLTKLRQVWENPPEDASDNLLIQWRAKYEAYQKAYNMVFDCFVVCGLEVLELQTEEV